ncbi:MAG: hypothetical protein RLZZ283_50 [Candidatus Parcubacteria bacterium]
MRILYDELRVFMRFFMVNVRAEAEQRIAFAIQQVSMILNNTFFVIAWAMFIYKFGEINGWGVIELIGLWGYSALAYGLTFSFFGGAAELKRAVNLGALDSAMLIPRSLYLRIFSLDIKTNTLGDVIFGVSALAAYAYFSAPGVWGALMLVAMLPAAVLIMANVLLITSCIAFFLVDSEHISNSAFYAFLDPSLYPAGGFQGLMRVVLIFIIPSLVVGGFPIEIAAAPTVWQFLLVWGLGVLWTGIGYATLHACVRFYESGNLTGARL